MQYLSIGRPIKNIFQSFLGSLVVLKVLEIFLNHGSTAFNINLLSLFAKLNQYNVVRHSPLGWACSSNACWNSVPFLNTPTLKHGRLHLSTPCFFFKYLFHALPLFRSLFSILWMQKRGGSVVSASDLGTEGREFEPLVGASTLCS